MFSIINDILRYKNGKSLTRSDFSDEYNLYMIQRWISMHSDFNVEILNCSVNTLYKTLDAEQQFKLMLEILPTMRPNGKYIKAIRKGKATRKEKGNEIDISHTYEESIEHIDESLKIVYGDKYNE